MDLQPGFRLVVAPRFHLAVDWAERLLLGAVQQEDGRFFPRHSWRTPSPEELRLLLGDPTLPIEDDACDKCLALLTLPQHLQAAFWGMLENEAQAPPTPRLQGWDGFVHEVARFLDFKGSPVPEDAVFDLVVSKPGQRSIQWDAEAAHAIGLTFNLASWISWPLQDETRLPRLWGGFNLGDEPVHVLLVNLPASHLAAELARDVAEAPPPTTLDELARRFLTHCPDYPLVRLRLDPGEGYRIPVGGVLIDACTLDTEGPGLMLMVRCEEAKGAGSEET